MLIDERKKHSDYIDKILYDGDEVINLITDEKFNKLYVKLHDDVENMEGIITNPVVLEKFEEIVDAYEEVLWISQIEALKVGMKCVFEMMTDKGKRKETLTNTNLAVKHFSKQED